MIEDSGVNKSGNAHRGAKQDAETKDQLKSRQEARRKIEDFLIDKELGLI